MNNESKKELLLVEDDVLLAAIEANSLEKNNYIVYSANSSPEAIDLFKDNENISLVLMDISLGEGMDGTDCAREILKIRNVPIIFLSAHYDKEIVEKVKNLTRYGYVVKSVNNHILFSTIEMAFELFEAQKKTSESEERFKLLAENSLDLICLHEPTGEYVYLSPSVEKILGYKEPELLGVSPYTIFHPDDLIRIQKGSIEKAHLGFEDLSIVYRVLHKKGYYIWLETKTKLIFKNEIIFKLQTASRDVTERILAEEELQKSRKQMQTMMDFSPMVVFMKDIEGKYLFVNESYKKFIEKPNLQLGQTDFDIFDKEFAEEYKKDDDIVFKTGDTLEHEHLINKEFFYETKFPIRDTNNNIYAVGGVSLNISDIKKTQKELLASRNRLAEAERIARTGNWYWDLKTKKFIWSEGNYRLFGLTRDEFDETYEGFLKRIHPDDIDNTKNIVDNAFRERKSNTWEFKIIKPNKEVKYLTSSMEVKSDPSGNVVSMFGTTLDITERKEAEYKSDYQAYILENVTDAVISTNSEFIITYWNKAAEKLYGWKSEEVLGKDLSNLIKTLYPNSSREKALSILLENNFWEEEVIQYDKDGHEHYVLSSVNYLINAKGLPASIVSVNKDITDRKKILERVKMLSLVARKTTNVVIITDAKGYAVWVNEGFTKLTEYTLNEIKGRKPSNILQGKESSIEAIFKMREAIKNGQSFDVDIINYTKTRNKYWVNIKADPFFEENGDLAGYVAIESDITARKLEEQELLIAAVAFESQEGMIVTDAKGIILRVNRSFVELTGYSSEEVIGKTPSILKSGKNSDIFYKQLWEILIKDGKWTGEIWNRRKNGELFLEWLTISGIKDVKGNVTNYVGSFIDITQKKEDEETIHELAFYDPLTKLPNRRLLLDRLNKALATSSHNLTFGAVIFIDLDNFKTLNDTKGHEIGDLLLIEVAKRLQACIKSSDTISRLGGDEYVVVLENLSHDETEAVNQVIEICENILSYITHNYQLNGNEYSTTPSMGITLFNSYEVSIEELLKRADMAMYEAKTSGKNNFRFFDPTTQAQLEHRTIMEVELRNSLSKNQLKLYYQMQVNISRKIIGAEILLRWEHPEHGLISPYHFIPLAEETGLIIPIGYWVIEQACEQIKKWENDQVFRSLKLAVNVSAKQFWQKDFVNNVKNIVTRKGINCSNLKLELTETLILDNADESIRKMFEIKSLGIGLSLDDFGTGYSSLSYIKQFPLEQIKIDQSFIRNIENSQSDAIIVKIIIDLSHNLGLKVIAEGVETEEQLDFLIRQGCTSFQGFLFGKPVPFEEFEKLPKIV